jgi:intein/homing endonuclease
MNIKVVELIKIYNFYKRVKLEERYVRFMNNITTIISDEQKTKIKVVDLDKLKNFVVDNSLIGNHLIKENHV